jgi:alpha-mannosidase
VEAGIALALGKLLGLPAAGFEHCSCNAGADCLNISVCAATTRKQVRGG